MNALISAGAKVDKAVDTNATPLYIAAQEGYVEVVNALIPAGAKVDKARDTNATPLMIVASYGRDPSTTLCRCGLDQEEQLRHDCS